MFEIIHQLLDDTNFQKQVKFTIKTFKQNEKIIEQGKQTPGVYLIKSGLVRVVVHSELDEKKVVSPGIADLKPNDIFGEFSLFDRLPASADVIAEQESELVEIDIPSFRKFLRSNLEVASEVYFEILKNLVSRLRHADKTIVNLYMWGIKAYNVDKHLE